MVDISAVFSSSVGKRSFSPKIVDVLWSANLTISTVDACRRHRRHDVNLFREKSPKTAVFQLANWPSSARVAVDNGTETEQPHSKGHLISTFRITCFAHTRRGEFALI